MNVVKGFLTYPDREIENTIKSDLKKLTDQNDLSGIKFLDTI